MLAACRSRAVLLLALLGTGDAVWSFRSAGLPLPTVALPTEAWALWEADAVPGAVVHVPLHSEHLQPNHPVRLAGRVTHGRALVAMPRSDTTPPEEQAIRVLDACTRRGAACGVPSLETLQSTGFRYVVLDLPETPERTTLERRLVEAWGAPDQSVAGLSWWRLPKR
jgi:hypothetical protein